MHMATACTPVDYDAWLAENSAYCHRLSARITLRACLENQQLSTGLSADLRCFGCNGLYDQSSPTSPRLCLVSAPVSIETETAQEPEALAEVDLSGLALNISPESSARILEQNPALVRELLALESEDDEQEPAVIEEDGIEEVRPTALQDRRHSREYPRRVAVYQGRCIRCGGYVMNDLERHDGIRDDEVYRCLSCGWRTSPAYEYNRKHPGLARPWGG